MPDLRRLPHFGSWISPTIQAMPANQAYLASTFTARAFIRKHLHVQTFPTTDKRRSIHRRILVRLDKTGRYPEHKKANNEGRTV